jgi:hypothetical protein
MDLLNELWGFLFHRWCKNGHQVDPDGIQMKNGSQIDPSRSGLPDTVPANGDNGHQVDPNG